MIHVNISIVLIVITVIVSGYYINFTKSLPKNEILKSSADSSLFLFRLFIPLSIILSIIIYLTGWTSWKYNHYIYFTGLIFVMSGLSLRWRAVYVLGKSFQANISIVQQQELFTKGVYKRLRHPAYSGLLLYYLGLGLIMQNSISLFILVLLPAVIVFIRIQREEAFLQNYFGEQYKNYKRHTYKVLPYIY